MECWLCVLVGFFVVDGDGHVEGGVESVLVAPGVNPVGYVVSCLGSGDIASVVDSFLLQGGENDSAAALSKAEPTFPMDWTIPNRLQALVKASAVYCPGSRGRRNTALFERV